MIKQHAYTLASRVLRLNQEMTVHLIRAQSGFLATKNVDQAQKMITDMQETLCELQKVLDAPPKPYPTPPSNYVPLK